MHFGSLVAAFASFVDARHRGGEWLVRIDDLDPPRTVAGAAERQLETLHAFGLHWDGPVVYQSTRTAAYAVALDELIAQGLVYPCGCSRKEIAAHGRAGLEGPIYPGTCRGGLPAGRAPRAWRFATQPGQVRFDDRIQGARSQDLAATVGDFVVRRADGIHAYQLAVVVDDAWQGITDIVRGADLVDSTPRQIALQRALALPTPTYAHVPLVLDPAGRKLSKSDAALPADPDDPLPALMRAWFFLGQAPLLPRPTSQIELLERAVASWDIARVRGRRSRPHLPETEKSPFI
ncbi:glutamyl-queuosine tRNA(Asp) synthetase [Thioflavicoccus mobilis 8321]|uniref:Glutamyl-Q tRNA(Asp) synthetase n=1 Tax=Thioflavicoccus mobilis 8321 TaxID=765912 RepID=L0GYL1_9GAMM|nr:glutamyl-queuosine tRNA(Asp) synthetase [Thioflavicoccus mobilis 8321]